DHATEARVASGDVDPGNAALLVGVGAEGDRDGPVADAVVAFDAVPGRPHAGDARRHAGIGRDAAARADAHAGIAPELHARRDTQTEHHEAALDRSVAGHDRAHASAVVDVEAFDPRVGDQLDAEAANGVGYERAHVWVKGVHRLGGRLDDGDGAPAVVQRLGELEADVAAADDDRALRPVADGCEICAEIDAVAEVLHSVHAACVDAGQVGTHRR